MLSDHQVIALFDLRYVQPYQGHPPAARPTPSSIARINRALDIALPASLIKFASACPSYGAWFASIGDDYDNPYHLLSLNIAFHATGEAGAAALPSWFVMINHGHDFDCDGFDKTHFDAHSGEYQVRYLCPDDLDGALQTPYPNFSSYLESFVLKSAELHYDNRNRSGRIRSGSRDIVKEVDRILSMPVAQ